jgi:N-acetylglutamate synthase (EC 2.3.1.1)/glutamate N-acetyltransferase (EC 2.3.1.35)
MIVPKGFYCNGWHAGIKKDRNKKDFGFIFSENRANAAAVFTKNKFVGNPIIVGREHIKMESFNVLLLIPVIRMLQQAKKD